MIRKLTKSGLKRLLTAAGLARTADVEHERRAVAMIRAEERARARRQAAAASAKLDEFDEKFREAHARLTAEHAECRTLMGLLRHYLVRLTRTEAELVERTEADRRLKLAQLAINAKAAGRRGVTPVAADRAAHFASVSADYSRAVSRWRAGDVPPDIRRVTIARLQWSVPSDTTDALSQRLLNDGRLPLDDLSAVREFAVGGVMLDIGAAIGTTSIPRVMLGDFAQVYAAEPNSEEYLCLVGNTLDNHLEGRVLPDRVAISGAEGTAKLLRTASGRIEEAQTLTLDEWIERLGIEADDVGFVRVAVQDWNLDLLHGAAHLLKRRHIVWQIEVDPRLMRTAEAAIDDLCARLAGHFTHLKELGRYWTEWHPAAEADAVLRSLSADRRDGSLLLFNIRGGTTRRRAVPAAPPLTADQAPGGGPMISLLHSTARLPDGWRPAMEAFLTNARNPKNVEYILAVDEDQEFVLPSNDVTGWGRCVLVKEGVTGPNSGYNAAAKISRGDILMTIADDYFPPAGWDEQIRRAISDINEEIVLDVDNSDGSTWLLPFSILTRKYYERYGYILYPGYHGLCSDNEFTEQVRRDGVVREARHIVFDHRHQDRGLAPMDEIYVRQKAHYEEAKKLFNARKAKGFPRWPD